MLHRAGALAAGMLQKVVMTALPDSMAEQGVKYLDEAAGGRELVVDHPGLGAQVERFRATRCGGAGERRPAWRLHALRPRRIYGE